MRLGVLVMTSALLAATAGAQDAPRLPQLPRPQFDRLPRLRALSRAYQGSGPEVTEQFSRKVKLGRDGRVTLTNISGDIVVSVGTGDEVSIDAVKRARGDRSQLAAVQINVAERPGRVDVDTGYQSRMNDRVSVDYTLTVPASAAVEVKSVSGDVKITGVRGEVRAEAVSGDVTIADTPKLTVAKVVSGDVALTNVASDADLEAASVSGSVHAKGLKTHGLDLATVSGDVIMTDVASDRLSMRSVSGDLEFTGALARNGRYDITTHSGSVRLTLTSDTGFELTASTFSGSLRSNVPTAVTNTREQNAPPVPPNRPGQPGRPAPPPPPGRRGSLQATYGDGSAELQIRTFSGDVTISKR